MTGSDLSHETVSLTIHGRYPEADLRSMLSGVRSNGVIQSRPIY